MHDVRGAGSLGQEAYRIAYASDEVAGLERGSHREHRKFTGPIIECAHSMAAGHNLDDPGSRIDRYEHSGGRVSQFSMPGHSCIAPVREVADEDTEGQATDFAAKIDDPLKVADLPSGEFKTRCHVLHLQLRARTMRQSRPGVATDPGARQMSG